MIIDSLTHITPDGKWFNTEYDCSSAALSEMMLTGGVDKAVVCSMPLSELNEYVLKYCKTNPDNFLPVAGFHPAGKDEKIIAEEILYLAKSGFIGIKIHPRISQLKLDSDEVVFAIRKAGQMGMTSFVCTIQRPPAQPLNRPLYDAIHYICEQCRESKIVLLHGGYYELLAVSEIVRPYENVFIDLSTTLQRFLQTSLKNDIKFLINTFDKRIVFGSDFPEHRYGDVKQILQSLGYDESTLEKQGILGNNFYNFLKQ